MRNTKEHVYSFFLGGGGVGVEGWPASNPKVIVHMCVVQLWLCQENSLAGWV